MILYPVEAHGCIDNSTGNKFFSRIQLLTINQLQDCHITIQPGGLCQLCAGVNLLPVLQESSCLYLGRQRLPYNAFRFRYPYGFMFVCISVITNGGAHAVLYKALNHF